MLRNLHHPLLKERSPARGLQYISSFSRSNLKHRHGASRKNAIILEYFAVKPSNSIVLRYSTLPETKEAHRKRDVPFPPGKVPSKPKVELRPAPLKISKEDITPTNPPPPPPVVEQVVNMSTSTSTQNDLLIPVPDPKLAYMGAFESTKFDLAESRRQGIMKPPPEGASSVSAFFHNLRQFFWFYYGGMKKIFVANRREVQTIKRRIRDSKIRGDDASMTRRETLIVRTFRQDVLRLFPFIITLLLLEEAIPVIVLYAPAFLPSTCLLPTQQDRIRAKRRFKQLAHLALAKSQLEGVASVASLVRNGVRGLPNELTTSVSGVFGHVTFLPPFIQRARLERYLSHLSRDDALLSKEDMGKHLTASELVETLEARGIVSEHRLTYSQHLQRLQWWLERATDSNARLALILDFALNSPTK